MNELKEFKAGELTVKIYETRAIMGREAANEAAALIKKLLEEKAEVNIVFAAAPSQNEFLASLSTAEGIDWGRINAFHMDEYIGLHKDAPQGFGNFLRDRIFGKLPFKSINYLNGNAENAEEECKRYSGLLKAFPTDIVSMGIGENGHIAFNDPHVADFEDKEMVKVVELDERCRNQQVNDGCFKTINEVPTHALTLTIPALLAGKYIFCVVPGSTKTEAVTNTVKGEITTACPASILKKHSNAVLYVDRDSGRNILQA